MGCSPSTLDSISPDTKRKSIPRPVTITDTKPLETDKEQEPSPTSNSPIVPRSGLEKRKSLGMISLLPTSEPVALPVSKSHSSDSMEILNWSSTGLAKRDKDPLDVSLPESLGSDDILNWEASGSKELLVPHK